jgi:hypothetical protein
MVKKVIAQLLAITTIVGTASSQKIDINGSITQTVVKTTGNQEDWSNLSNTKDGSFEFAEILIGASSQLSEKCRAGAQLISRDFGTLGNFETQLDWGYGDYRFYEQIGIRAGKMKLPRGLYNEARDVDGARTNILLDQGMYPEDWRSFITSFQGVGLYGVLEKPGSQWGSLDYQIYAGTINIPDDFFFVSNLKKNIDQNFNGLDSKSLKGFQLGYSPTRLSGLKLNTTFLSWKGSADLYLYNQGPVNGATVFNGAHGTSLNAGQIDSAVSLDYDSYELGFEYFWKKATFFGEIQKVYVRASYSSDVQAAQSAFAALSNTDKMSLSNQLIIAIPTGIDPYTADTYSWNLGLNYQWTESLQTRVAYSQHNSNKDIDDGENRTVFSVRYDINYNMIAKLEYTDYFFDGKTSADNHYGLFMARLGFSF